MRFDPYLAQVRFGCGLSPTVAGPQSRAQMLEGLTSPDAVAARFPIEPFEDFQTRLSEGFALNQIRRENRGSDEALAAKKARRVLNKRTRVAQMGWLGQHFNRWVHTDAPLRERLTLFWADHFTATGKAGLIRRAASPYVETAIRPNVTAKFEDMLLAAILHPGDDPLP